MSKDKMKNLLNESTIRRFMKLAEIDALSDDFVDNLAVEEAPVTEEVAEEAAKEESTEESEESTEEPAEESNEESTEEESDEEDDFIPRSKADYY